MWLYYRRAFCKNPFSHWKCWGLQLKLGNVKDPMALNAYIISLCLSVGGGNMVRLDCEWQQSLCGQHDGRVLSGSQSWVRFQDRTWSFSVWFACFRFTQEKLSIWQSYGLLMTNMKLLFLFVWIIELGAFYNVLYLFANCKTGWNSPSSHVILFHLMTWATGCKSESMSSMYWLNCSEWHQFATEIFNATFTTYYAND